MFSTPKNGKVRLNSEIPKRQGIVKSHHHLMYIKENQQSFCDRVCSCKHLSICFLIGLAVAIVITGALATTYAYVVPMIYKSLGEAEDSVGEMRRIVKVKRIFMVLGFGLIGLGLCICVFSAIMQVFIEHRDVRRNYVDQIDPIVVDYELPPYDVRLEKGNFNFEEDSDYFYHVNDEQTPLVDSEVRTVFVQQSVK